MSLDTTSFFATIHELNADAVAVSVSATIVAGYYIFQFIRAKRSRVYSMHYVNELTRRIWVETVMGSPGYEIMAVQTMRNFIMVGILMVSTSTLLIMGTLTLSGQAETINKTWHVLNLVEGSHSAKLWIIKVMCLLADFLIAFFSYAMAIRLANQILFMINIPREYQPAHEALTPYNVARRLNMAGYMFAIGMRSYFFAIPLVFWLFGPVFLVTATIGLVIILSRLDRHQTGI